MHMKTNWLNSSVKKLIATYSESNPQKIIRDLSRELVLKAFNLGWSGPPYNPIELAKLLKIEVTPNEEIGDARIIPVGSEKLKIQYNPFQKEARINFSIAHEIGHTFFPDCGDKIRNREEVSEGDLWELEFLCNIAASEILLPYAAFSEDANSKELSLNSLLEISNKYKASLESVFLRFCEVVDNPCAIMIATFQDDKQTKLKVDYFKSSHSLNLPAIGNYIIPKTSKAYECLNAGWTSHANEKWEILGNNSFTIYSIGLPPLKKHKQPRVGLFLVPMELSKYTENKLYTIFGDATKPRGYGNKIIVQLLNTSGGMGFGFGKSMGTKWPASKQTVLRWKEDKKNYKLGSCKLTKLNEDTYVFQMIAQEGLFEKNGVIPLKYDVLSNCLKKLSIVSIDLSASIHMPQIGAGQAKGDWNIIQGMIHDELVVKGILTSIYILPGTKANTSKSVSNLSLFDESTLYEK